MLFDGRQVPSDRLPSVLQGLFHGVALGEASWQFRHSNHVVRALLIPLQLDLERPLSHTDWSLAQAVRSVNAGKEHCNGEDAAAQLFFPVHVHTFARHGDIKPCITQIVMEWSPSWRAQASLMKNVLAIMPARGGKNRVEASLIGVTPGPMRVTASGAQNGLVRTGPNATVGKFTVYCHSGHGTNSEGRCAAGDLSVAHIQDRYFTGAAVQVLHQPDCLLAQGASRAEDFQISASNYGIHLLLALAIYGELSRPIGSSALTFQRWQAPPPRCLTLPGKHSRGVQSE